jgi:signal transduction histidine kinase
MATTAATAVPQRRLMRDSVLVLPVVVVVGLVTGLLGVQANVSGARITTDLLLPWALAAAFVLVMERPRWRSAGWPLAAAAFAILGADLVWSTSSALGTLGFMLEGLWVACLARFVLAFPEGRPWSRSARLAVAGAVIATLGAQLVGVLFATDTRDLLSVSPQENVAHAIDRVQEFFGAAVGIVVLVLVLQRLHFVRGLARRSQGPILVATVVSVLVGLAWLSRVIAIDGSATTFETIARATVLSLPAAVIAVILWSRLRRPQAADLVVELRTQTPATMRERLARALGDPTLEVAYRIEGGRYVDASGSPVELPEGGDRAVTAVTSDGEAVAALIHDPALLDEPALVESVRATAALVLENERLAAEVRSQLAEVRASRGRIVAAADAERRRIERNLHDGAQQRLVTLSLALGLEASRADDDTAAALVRAQDDVEEAIAELRELARGIHPTLLRDDGLRAAVEALARRVHLPVSVDGAVRERLPEPVDLAAYFVVAEALTNAVKHGAPSRVSVLLEQRQDRLFVTVADDGRGGARITPGSGLAGLRDRLEALDATLAVDSRLGHGTTIHAEFPCES